MFERAARLAETIGDRAEEAESLQYVLATMHRGRMPVERALARFDELRSRTTMNRRLEAAFLETRAHLQAMQMNFDDARELVQQATALVVDAGLHKPRGSDQGRHVVGDAGAGTGDAGRVHDRHVGPVPARILVGGCRDRIGRSRAGRVDPVLAGGAARRRDNSLVQRPHPRAWQRRRTGPPAGAHP